MRGWHSLVWLCAGRDTRCWLSPNCLKPLSEKGTLKITLPDFPLPCLNFLCDSPANDGCLTLEQSYLTPESSLPVPVAHLISSPLSQPVFSDVRQTLGSCNCRGQQAARGLYRKPSDWKFPIPGSPPTTSMGGWQEPVIFILFTHNEDAHLRQDSCGNSSCPHLFLSKVRTAIHSTHTAKLADATSGLGAMLGTLAHS